MQYKFMQYIIWIWFICNIMQVSPSNYTITFPLNSFKNLAREQSVQIQISGALCQKADIIFTQQAMHNEEAAQWN